MDLHQPHDSFAKKALAKIEVAKDLLKAYLSPEIVRIIDWNTLQLTNKSYVTEQLNQLHSDVVYQCQVDGKKAYIYNLIEHQSTPDPMMPFRILKYNVLLMEEHLAQGHKTLPIVVNLCLYSGQQSPYPYSSDIYDCFEDPVLARAMIFKPLELIDLTTRTDEELEKHGQADLIQILLKHSQERSFLAWIKDNPALVQKLLERLYGISGVVYILGVEKKYSSEEIIDAILEVAPNRKEDIMTAAQQLIQKGMQQGMQQGTQQGEQNKALAIARNMLFQLHLGLDVIEKATGLSKEELEQLQKDRHKS